MRKYFPIFVVLLTFSVLSLPIRSLAQEVTGESTAPTSSEVTASPSAEATFGATGEAVTSPASTESTPGNTVEAAFTGIATTTATATITATATASAAATSLSSTETRSVTAETIPPSQPPAEGSSYNGVPWGADFDTFKTVKGFAGNLGPQSAALVGSSDDNDIALLMGVPVAEKDQNGEQRIMFEYLPQKFATVYYEPDDTYYIFYNGKFALTFAYINSSNFDLYRDTFYKKYAKTGDFSKKYLLGAKRSAQLQAGIFEKGKTQAFLIKSELTNKKEISTTAKLVFAYRDLFAAIRQEITGKMAADKLSGSEKNKQQLEKDLNKIE